jgi:hypothetical protein
MDIYSNYQKHYQLIKEDSMYETNDVMVSHPPHYQSETGLEVIDVIEAFTFDLKGIEAICTGNVLKYICRWPQKNGLQDLKKAMWYLQRLIDHVEELEEENKPVPKDEGDCEFGISTQEAIDSVACLKRAIIDALEKEKLSVRDQAECLKRSHQAALDLMNAKINFMKKEND